MSKLQFVNRSTWPFIEAPEQERAGDDVGDQYCERNDHKRISGAVTKARAFFDALSYMLTSHSHITSSTGAGTGNWGGFKVSATFKSAPTEPERECDHSHTGGGKYHSHRKRGRVPPCFAGGHRAKACNSDGSMSDQKPPRHLCGVLGGGLGVRALPNAQMMMSEQVLFTLYSYVVHTAVPRAENFSRFINQRAVRMSCLKVGEPVIKIRSDGCERLDRRFSGYRVREQLSQASLKCHFVYRPSVSKALQILPIVVRRFLCHAATRKRERSFNHPTIFVVKSYVTSSSCHGAAE
ncbi:MAG: hypothetical protein MI806_25990 [Minwuiales bacterium]|nr:hypothetical protein [Minwuiales bacterium]